MPILNSDLKLLAAEQNNDSNSGGGSMTANEVIDGVVNNLFNDVSRTDRTHGRLSLRKTFFTVQSANTDQFLGAHAIVSRRAADPAVSVAMFGTGSMNDQRVAAQNRMENYIVIGGRSVYELYGDHLAGTRRLMLHTYPGAPLPAVDQVLVLRSASGLVLHYARIARVEPSSLRVFTVPSGGSTRQFIRQMVSCDLQTPIGSDFAANDVTDLALANPATGIYETMAGSGATYYGCMDLEGAPAQGSQSVTAADVYTQIVPAADVESPFYNLTPWTPGDAVRTFAYDVTSGTRRYNWTHQVLYALQGGHMTVDYMVFGKWVRLEDNGTGQLIGRPGAGSGAIDYATGSIIATLGALPDVGSKVLFTWRTPVATNVLQRKLEVPTSFPVNTTLVTPVLPGSVSVMLEYTSVRQQTTYSGGWTFAPHVPGNIVWTPLTSSTVPVYYLSRCEIKDDGNGNLVNNGFVVGSINYATGALQVGAFGQDSEKTLIFWQTAAAAPATYTFRIAGAPFAAGSVQIEWPTFQGNVILQSQLNGSFTGGGAGGPTGSIDYLTGVVTLSSGSGDYLAAHPILISGVGIKKVPLDKSLIGIDATRMPPDGRVPLVAAGQSVVIHHTQDTALAPGLTSGQVSTMPRTNLAWAEVYDALGVRVPEDRYTFNGAAGTLTWNNPINLAGFVEPLTVRHRIEEMRLVTDVQFTGEIALALPLSRAYPAGSQVSTIMEFGDLEARISVLFRQAAWGSVWSDTVIGGTPAGSYNDAIYPVELSNTGAIPQRWALVFTSASTFNVVAEELGVIATTGTTGADCAPVNPATGTPYFTLRSGGWSAGWASGNVLRFNTAGTVVPLWLARTTAIAPDSFGEDDFRIEMRGDVQ